MTTSTPSLDLHDSFKAYDVRGIVGESITAESVRAVGAAFVDVLGLAGHTVLVGGDMRPSSPAFMTAFAEGATRRGADVVTLGLISTDMLYYAAGVKQAAGVVFTASHNPAEYNGMKMAQAGAVPVSSDTGLFEIRDAAQAYLDAGEIPAAETAGTVTEEDILPGYAAYLRSLVDLTGVRRLKVVVDAGNGMAGKTTPAVLGDAELASSSSPISRARGRRRARVGWPRGWAGCPSWPARRRPWPRASPSRWSRIRRCWCPPSCS